MITNTDILNLTYVGVMLGSAILLGLFWRLLPWLLTEDVSRNDIPTEAQPRPARASNIRFDSVFLQP